MSAIVVENLGKRYRIGHQVRHDTLRDALVHGMRRFLPAPRRDPQAAGREDFWALQDVSFLVEPGEVVGIIGRNGAGKSTLLKILSRITEPTTGRITLNGRVASLLEVGTGFHPELSGRENIYLNGAILGMSRAEIRRKFDEIVAFSEVEKFLDTPVKRYSSGMYVRLAFAVAAHLEPEILIVDEVLAVGDAQFQKKCLGKIQNVARSEGRTVLFVSHNMAAVNSLCARAAFLENGRLVHYGDTTEAVALYFKDDGGAKEGAFLRPSPAPSLPVYVRSVMLKNRLGQPAASLENGSPFILRVGYECQASFNEPVIPSVIVSTAAGTPVFHHHSRLNKRQFSGLPRSGEFEYVLPRLPLPADNYRLSVSLVSGNRILDTIEKALEFSVVDGCFYPAGESTPSSHGLVLVEGEWGLVPDAAGGEACHP